MAAPQRAPTPATPPPPVADVAKRYVEAWEARRYTDMYRLLSASARQAITEEKFVGRYRAITEGATISAVKPTLAPIVQPPPDAVHAEVQFSATLQTSRFGELVEQYRLPLLLEENAWKVEWTPDLIFKDLAPDRSVRVVEEDASRGAILDRNGVPLAQVAKIPTLGVIPAQIKEPDRVIGELAGYLKTDPGQLRQKLAGANPEWYLQLGSFPPDKAGELRQRFGQMPGVLVETKEARAYPQGSTAPHLIGYVSAVTPEDLKTLAAKGYGAGDYVGRTGIEGSQETVLAGVRGGRLLITNPSGETVRVVAERSAKPGADVQLTIDIELQKKAEAILGDKVGSLVLMDPRDNTIRAMATSPRFDPAGFVTGYSDEQWKQLSADPRRPFLNRPAMSTYATGSIFKVITMAAGIERGGFRPDSRFQCNGKWSLPNSRIVFGDWLPQGHGALDLTQGLTESCDIVFYEVGKKLNDTDPNLLPSFAQQFGLGEPTGIQGITEAAGVVPSPEWKPKALGEDYWPGDAINLSIGQGYLDATPLQMANVYSAIANGGTLRTPVLIQRTGASAAGGPPRTFPAEEKRKLPVRPETLAAIREGMRRVTSTPKGTASYAFNGYRIPVASKTGSAENQYKEAHAWYAGFGPIDQPQIVVIAMVEGGEAGGRVAAPLGRQAFEAVLGK